MKTNTSIIYRDLQTNMPKSIRQRIVLSLENERKNQQAIRLFFRADDAAIPCKNWSALINLFLEFQVPLNIAVVPAWITPDNWKLLKKETINGGTLFSWHQHGWCHLNHEIAGKKNEFGSSRNDSEIYHDLVQGKTRLKEILGNSFTPIFTPPWNRCDSRTISMCSMLVPLDFKALSRDFGQKQSQEVKIPEFQVHVDLHTSKKNNSVQGWNKLFTSLQEAIQSGECGIMIHHERMDIGTFRFLRMLLTEIKARPWISTHTFNDLMV